MKQSVKRDPSRKPEILPIKADNIPQAMRELNRWLGWRWTLETKKDGTQKWDKPPIDVRRNCNGSSTDSSSWCDFDTALRAAQSGFTDGIGFALGDGFCGVDFDECRDRSTGVIEEEVQTHAARLNTYGEVSPSKEGIKLVLRGKLPKGGRSKGKVEMYDSGRYFTVTGHRLGGCPAALASNDAALAALHAELIEAPDTVSKHRRESNLDDRELALAALEGLSPSRADNYHDWLLVGMALRKADASLLSAWDNWSKASDKYAAGDCEAKWQSFNGAAVGIGSLIYWAQRDTGWTPPRSTSNNNKKQKEQRPSEAVLTCLADVPARAISWLWPGRIPLGRLTLLAGRPGGGKSFATCDWTARVSTGTPWPDRTDCPRGSIILMTGEDDPGDTIRPRLDAHYADVQRIHLLSAVRRVDADGEYQRMITLADVDAIESALKKLNDCKLIVIDPIGSFLGGATDAHRDNEVRGVLAPIGALAEKYGPAVLIVAHIRKANGTSADDLVLGSRAFTGIARAVWHLTRDPDDKSRRLLLPGKNNLAAEGTGLAFKISGEPACCRWEHDPIEMHADDAVAESQRPGPESEALKAAVEWLTAALKNGPRMAKELADEFTNGEGGSKRTLERAKAKVAEAYRPKVPGPWYWRLPFWAKDAKDANPAPN